MRELETQRLKLRRITRGDVQAIFDNWASDPEVTKYMTWNPHKKISDTYAIMDYWLDEYDKPGCYRWGIELKSDGTLIGMIDVVGHQDGCPVIGYCSGKKFWGNGYMTEAMRAVVDELFADGYETLLVYATAENTGSNRVIQKTGFELTECKEELISPLKPEIMLINHYVLKKR